MTCPTQLGWQRNGPRIWWEEHSTGQSHRHEKVHLITQPRQVPLLSSASPSLFTSYDDLHYQTLPLFNTPLWLLNLDLSAMLRLPAFMPHARCFTCVVHLLLIPRGEQVEAQKSKGTPHSLHGAPDEKECVC